MEADRDQRLYNQARLRKLADAGGPDLQIICSHDPVLFETSATQDLEAPRRTPARPVNA